MSFVVKGSFGEIEVDCIINGLITPNKMIMFNAMLVDGRKIYLKGQIVKKKKQHQPINLSTNGETGKKVTLFLWIHFLVEKNY